MTPPSADDALPAATVVLRGPSYPVGLKLLAASAMAVLVPLAAVSPVWVSLPSDLLLAAGALAAVTLWQWAEIMGSVTELDAQGLRYGLLRTRHVAWADVTQARLIAWRGQESWFGARLVLQVRGQGRRVVRLGQRELVDAADAVLQASRTAPPPQN